MNSLQDLNYYSNVGIGFVDNITPGFVTFSNVTPVNQAVTVILDTPIIAPVGTDIIEAINTNNRTKAMNLINHFSVRMA